MDFISHNSQDLQHDNNYDSFVFKDTCITFFFKYWGNVKSKFIWEICNQTIYYTSLHCFLNRSWSNNAMSFNWFIVAVHSLNLHSELIVLVNKTHSITILTWFSNILNILTRANSSIYKSIIWFKLHMQIITQRPTIFVKHE